MNGIDAGAVLQTHIRHPYLLGIFALLVIASLMVAVMHSPRIERRIMPISVVSLLVFAFLLVVLSLVGIYRSVLVEGQRGGELPMQAADRVTRADTSSAAPLGRTDFQVSRARTNPLNG